MLQCGCRDAITFAFKREQSRIYSSYAEQEQNVRIKLRLYGGGKILGYNAV